MIILQIFVHREKVSELTQELGIFVVKKTGFIICDHLDPYQVIDRRKDVPYLTPIPYTKRKIGNCVKKLREFSV